MTNMKIAKTTILAVGLAAGVLSAVAQTTNKPPVSDKLSPEEQEKIGYALGVNAANNMQRSILTRIEVDVDTNAAEKGFADRLSGKARYTDDEVNKILDGFQKDLHDILNAKHRKEGDKFRADFMTKPGAKSLDSGVLYMETTPGTGGIPTVKDTASVNYTGWHLSGTVFASSASLGHPIDMDLKNVLPGLSAVLTHMKKGAKWQVVIPPELAYGDIGFSPAVGAGETLLYELELVDFRPTPPKSSPPPVVSPIVEVPSADALKNGAQPRTLTPEDVQKETQKLHQTNK